MGLSYEKIRQGIWMFINLSDKCENNLIDTAGITRIDVANTFSKQNS